MKFRIIGLLLLVVIGLNSFAQRNCSSYTYLQKELVKDPMLAQRLNQPEVQTSAESNIVSRVTELPIIRIPVVVHILYHQPSENISDSLIHQQIEILNKCFRHQNADSVNTPAVFAGLAADTRIEFQLAISNPRRANTTGIVRKYTPITDWKDDDKMKFSNEYGDDAWDTRSYLNIWVCNMTGVAGYSSIPGSSENKDGIVIDYKVFGANLSGSNLDQGKTTVHEAGHWLNLKHIWGDEYCADDFVNDTPTQSWYNSGCPQGPHISCNNGPNGDMYMNYMDFTDDRCVNLFTKGQAARMRSLFVAGGKRNSILNSTGLLQPLINESPIPEEVPTWLHYRFYPNPAPAEVTLDLAYDPRWIGSTFNITNTQGQVMMKVNITSKIQVINVSRLRPGMYFLTGSKGSETIRQKFIKL